MLYSRARGCLLHAAAKGLGQMKPIQRLLLMMPGLRSTKLGRLLHQLGDRAEHVLTSEELVIYFNLIVSPRARSPEAKLTASEQAIITKLRADPEGAALHTQIMALLHQLEHLRHQEDQGT